MTEIQGVPPPPPPPEDSTTSKPATSPSTPYLHPSHGGVPSIHTLRSWLPLYLHKADSTLSHLSRILATPSGTDSLLSILQYSSLATSALLSTISLRRFRAQLLALLSLARALPSDTTTTTILITSASSSSSSLPTSPSLRIATSLSALSDLISSHRMFSRLFGLLSLYKWARSLLSTKQQQSTDSDRVLQRIAYSQLVVNVVYQYLENGAYLSSKGVLGWDARRQASAWMWSSRCWGAHVALELTRLAYLWSEHARRREKGKGREMDGNGSGGEGGVVVTGVEVKTEDVEAWRRDLISNLAYAPLTVHWSLSEGFVGDFWIGVLGTIASGVGFAQVWKSTA